MSAHSMLSMLYCYDPDTPWPTNAREGDWLISDGKDYIWTKRNDANRIPFSYWRKVSVNWMSGQSIATTYYDRALSDSEMKEYSKI